MHTTQFLLACFVLSLMAMCVHPAWSRSIDVWVGTTTPREGPSKGIYHALLDTESGQLTKPTLAAEIKNPGFLTMHPQLPILFTTGVVDAIPSVVAFQIQQESAGADDTSPVSLRQFSHQAVGDGGATHIAADASGKVLLSAQYGGGSTALFPLSPEGAIRPRAQLVKHQGGSRTVPGRQDKPHAHWVGVAPDNRFVFVPDLGLDQVVIYALDTEQPKLHPHGHGQAPRGGGPRHMKFHPHGKTIYVLNELALSVTVFDYDPEHGRMTPVQTIATVPAEEKAKEKFVSASEIRVHPTGKFVYAANRGHDTVTAFRVTPETGHLSVIEREPVRGSWPRNFNIDPTGRWLLAAGRDSNTLAVFEIDSESGELTYGRVTQFVPTPICVLFGR